MTPSSLLRVYHSRDVAMKFQMTGERNLQNLLLSDQLFTGYQPPETTAALIFGTDFTAAAHILGRHLDGPGAQRPIYVKRRGGKGYAAIAGTTGELLRPANLGNPVYYLPLGKDSLPLLRMMGYPMWQEMLLREISRELFHFDNHPRWSIAQDSDGCRAESEDRLSGLAGAALPSVVRALCQGQGYPIDTAARRIYGGTVRTHQTLLGGKLWSN